MEPMCYGFSDHVFKDIYDEKEINFSFSAYRLIVDSPNFTRDMLYKKVYVYSYCIKCGVKLYKGNE